MIDKLDGILENQKFILGKIQLFAAMTFIGLSSIIVLLAVLLFEVTK